MYLDGEFATNVPGVMISVSGGSRRELVLKSLRKVLIV